MERPGQPQVESIAQTVRLNVKKFPSEAISSMNALLEAVFSKARGSVLIVTELSNQSKPSVLDFSLFFSKLRLSEDEVNEIEQEHGKLLRALNLDIDTDFHFVQNQALQTIQRKELLSKHLMTWYPNYSQRRLIAFESI